MVANLNLIIAEGGGALLSVLPCQGVKRMGRVGGGATSARDEYVVPVTLTPRG